MSVGPMGLIGGFAAATQAQNQASEQLAGQAHTQHARAAQGTERAEAAAGIGQTEEHGDAQDRDADGRRPWELGPRTETAAEESSEQDSSQPTGPRARDPDGERGNQLDICG